MKCKTVQKFYISFIDNELSELETQQVQDHLSSCSDCSKKVNTLKEIYQPKSCLQKVESPPFLWQKLYLKISEQEKKTDIFLFSEKLLNFVVNASVVAIFVFSILFGIYLGSSPNLTTADATTQVQDVIVSDEFENDSYINTFDDLPRESIANVYLTMEME